MLMLDIKHKDLAERVGTTSTNLSNKMSRNNFSVNELEEIATALGCELSITFTDKDSGRTF